MIDNSTLQPGDDSQTVLNKLILEYMQEEKRKRKWRWVKRALFLLVIIFIVYLVLVAKNENHILRTKSHVGLIDVTGTIFENETAGSEAFAKGLEAAYSSFNLKAIIIRINSPGGSPVQAEYMYNTLLHYRQKFPSIKTYAVCVDACASAAYYVAVGTDEIYASPASLVGSIGVLYNGFGFVDTLQKLGVSRRLHTSGSNKGFLDPFSPENPAQEQHLQTMLDLIHKQFITRVKTGRGNKLKPNDEIFSGLFWTGEQALGLGLIDGIASSGQLARDVIKEEEVVDYTDKQNIIERFAKNIGVALADKLPEALGLTAGFR